MRLYLKKGFLVILGLIITLCVQAQVTVVHSSDSLVKVSSVLSEDVLLHEYITDTLTIEINEEKPIVFAKLTANEFVSKYKQSLNVLDKLKINGGSYCEVVPNCDKILKLPIIKAVHQLDASRYALIGYVRAKSPVFIIRHIWILDISNTPRISQRILYLGNQPTISFGYNLSQNEIVLYQQLPKNNGIREHGVFVMDASGIISDNGVSMDEFNQNQFFSFLKVAQEHPQVGLGFAMFEIPSGNKIERMPPLVNLNQPIYRIKLD